MGASLHSRLWGAIAGLVCLGGVEIASAQYSFQQTPFHTASHSFYENIGTTWGVQGRGWFFNFGGPGVGAGNPPPFGGFDPNARRRLARVSGGMASADISD